MYAVQQVHRKLSFAGNFVRHGDYEELSAILRTKAWGTELALGMARDLAIPFPAPTPLIPILLRPIQNEDVPGILDVTQSDISSAERRDRLSRLQLLDAGFSTCLVATTEENRPCFIQWLIPADENRLLRQSFNDLFPSLNPNEMLLEGAYIPPAFRGKRIMPAAMAMVAERAAQMGATRALTFVGQPNIPSVVGCERAGFIPTMTRRVVHRFGYRRVTFHPLSENDEHTTSVTLEP